MQIKRNCKLLFCLLKNSRCVHPNILRIQPLMAPWKEQMYSGVKIRWHTRRNQISSSGGMWLGGGDSSVDYWQPRCAVQLVAFVLCWRGYAPRSCEHAGYPLHSPVAPSFPLPHIAVCHVLLIVLYTTLLFPAYFTQVYKTELGSSPVSYIIRLLLPLCTQN
jgi:hypothetical protein